MFQKKLNAVLMFMLLITLGINNQTRAQSTFNGGGVIYPSEGLITKLIVVPPYPASFRELMEKQGNSIILQNISSAPMRLHFNFSFTSIDGDISIASLKPLMVVDLAPNSTQSIPLSKYASLLSPSNLNCSGINKETALQYTPLPEGYYTLCLKPIMVSSNISAGKDACSSTIPLFAIEPPTLRIASPINNDTIINVQPQNLLFQWNTPSRIDPTLINTLQSTIKIVEVANGLTAVQAFQTASSKVISYITQGQNFFIYGTSCSPLVVGRRYAAVVQITDPQHKVMFRNAGNSEVINFVYGKSPKNYAPGEAPFAYQVSGSVQWAYKATEEIQSKEFKPLLSNTPIAEKHLEIVKSNEAGKNTYSLANALVEVFGSNTRPNSISGSYQKQSIATAKTDEQGNYNLSLAIGKAMQKFKYLTIEVSHPSGLFSKVFKTVEYGKVQDGDQIEPLVLVGQTLEFTPSVHIANELEDKGVFINILIPEKQWSKYSFLSVAGLGETKSLVSYNNQQYKVVAKLENGNTYKKLFQTIQANEYYLVQINYPDRAPAYFPIDEVYLDNADALGQKPVLDIAKNYTYDNTNQVSGTVKSFGKPRWDVRVKVLFDKADVLGKFDELKEYSAITDNDGYYAIKGLPNLKKGAILHFVLDERVVSTATIEDQLIVSKNGHLVKDFDIKNPKHSVKGHVVDKNGVAIENVFVMLINSNKTTRTDHNGDYILEVEALELKNDIQFLADGYQDKQESLQLLGINNKQAKIFANKADNLPLQLKTTILSNLLVKSSLIIDVRKLETDEAITRGTLSIIAASGKTKTMSIDLSTVGKDGYLFEVGEELDTKGYTIRFTPASADETSIAIAEADVPLSKGQQYLHVGLKPTGTYVVSGVVKSGISNALIAQQLITATDGSISYRTTTDRSGRFQLTFPKNATIQMIASKVTFLTFDSSFKRTIDTDTSIVIVLKSSSNVAISQLAGFNVSLTKISTGATQNGVVHYSISGSISLSDIGISTNFTASANSSKINFNNVDVTVTNNNAVPSANVELSASSINLQLYNFAALAADQSGTNKIYLKKLPGASDYSKGVIGCKLVMYPTKLSTSTFQLPTAPIVDKTNNTDSFFTIFGFGNNTKTISTSYDVYFGNRTSSVDNIKYGIAALLNNDSLKLDSAVISSAGISKINGYFQLGKKLGFHPVINNKISEKTATALTKITNASINTNFSIGSFSVYNSGSTIISGAIQKIQSKFSNINFTGLGTTNASMTMVGDVTIVKNGPSQPFSQMSVVNPGGTDYALSSSMTLNAPINIGGLKFKLSSSNTGVSFFYSGYNTSSASYNITYGLEMSLDLSLQIAGLPPAFKTMTKSIFQKDITGQFNYQTANAGVFVAATANQVFSLRVCEITINSFLLNLGTTASIDYMDKILNGEVPAYTINTNPEDTAIIEANPNWAFGINGGVSFSAAKSMKASASGIVLVAKDVDGYKAKVDDLEIAVENDVFKIEGTFGMTIDDDKQGFEATALLELNNVKSPITGFGAGFKYYYYTTGGINLGASIKVTGNVDVGPVSFHSFGGGFELDTKINVYKVFVEGDFGPKGTTADQINVNARLDLEFSSACNYVPIIKGTGSLTVGQINVAKAEMTMDLCNNYFLVKVVGSMDLPAPLGSVAVTNTLFIVAPINGKGAFYLATDIKVNIAFILPNVNAGYGLGLNINSNNTYLPSYCKTALIKYIGAGTTLNGLYLYGERSQNSGSKFGFDLLIISASLEWNLSTQYGMKFMANLTPVEVRLWAYAKAHVDGKASISLLGYNAGIGGSCDIELSGDGGFTASGFDINVYGNAQLQVYGGFGSDGKHNSCNDYTLNFSEFSGKACFGMRFTLGIRSGQDATCSFSFN